ncbi:MAG: hypothetical protein R3C10_09040 [Pirellulales bacterium]
MPELGHVDVARVAFSWSQTRKAVPYGIYASLTPLRFRGGALSEQRDGQTWVTQRIVDRDGRDFLYLMTFYLPLSQLPGRGKAGNAGARDVAHRSRV